MRSYARANVAGMISGSRGITRSQSGMRREQLLEHHPDLNPCQLRTQAEMRAESERHMSVVGSGHIEDVRIRERAGITIRRGIEKQKLVPLADLLSVELVVDSRRPTHIQTPERPNE